MFDDNMDNQPLAYRMAPRTLDEYVGQEHIIGEGKMLRRMIKADRLSSVIFFGPPGVGKTALARLIANQTQSDFHILNAVTSGVADIKKVVEKARELKDSILSVESRRTVLFIDEIHRFNKLQQDALLPFVENGTIILIGATTENPFFEVNKALISRSTVLQLKPLTEDNIVTILKNAIADKERGFGIVDIKISDDDLKIMASLCSGDARNALKALEIAIVTTTPDGDGTIVIDKNVISECMQKKTQVFDKDGENHYDNISAMIKSMRGSNPDAAILYLARAIEAGEDIEFLARRILICASEDVGMANPNALVVANAAYEGVHKIGMPEARILLAEACIMVASSPKSNASYLAIEKALNDVRTKDTGEVPLHLRNAPVKEMEELGYKVNYKYPHDYDYHYCSQQYLPDVMADTKYYLPTDLGYERKINEYLKFINNLNG